MDYQAAKFWLDAALTILAAGGVIYTWLSNRHRANKTEINEIEKRATDLETSFKVMEEKVNKLPNEKELHKTLLQLKETQGELAVLNKRLDGVVEVIKRIERPLELLVEAEIKGNKS